VEDNTSSAILNLASFAQLEQFWAARLDASTEEASMSFEEFESSLGRKAHEIENEIKAHELARYNVSCLEINLEGKVFRKCLDSEPKRFMTASGSVVVKRNLYRAKEGGKSICQKLQAENFRLRVIIRL
jgi:hypothetical protein